MGTRPPGKGTGSENFHGWGLAAAAAFLAIAVLLPRSLDAGRQAGGEEELEAGATVEETSMKPPPVEGNEAEEEEPAEMQDEGPSAEKAGKEEKEIKKPEETSAKKKTSGKKEGAEKKAKAGSEKKTGKVSISKTLLPATSFSLNRPGHWFRFKGHLEMGFIGIVKHRIQFSKSGTEIDYRKDGGQDVLFFFWRISADFEIKDHHKIVFLYQPLDIRTKETLSRDISIDELIFPEDTPVDFRYGFDFYRLSYMYDFFADPDQELAVGLSLQLRNAQISFTSADGTLRRSRSDLGPVPVIKLRGRYTFKPGVWIGLEADGFWASGRIITGSTNDFEGAILDASLRIGFNMTGFLESFVNVRYIGGGARGTDEESTGPGDGYTNNWIHTMSLSLGLGFK